MRVAGCNATKNERLTDFLNNVMKMLQNVQEEVFNGVSL